MATTRKPFKYKSPSADSMSKYANKRWGGKFDSYFKEGFDIYRPKVGQNIIRILPPTWDNYDHFAYLVWLHKFIGADSSIYLCLKHNINPKTGTKYDNPCAICDASRKSRELGDKEEADKLSAKVGFICWIVDRAGEETAQLYTLSGPQDTTIVNLCKAPRTKSWIDIAHDETGYDLVIDREGKDLRTKYVFSIDRESSPLSEDPKKAEELIFFAQDNPIPSLLKYYSNEYLEKVIEGKVEKEGEDDSSTQEEEEEKPRTSKYASRDQEDEDASDEEENRPVQRAKLKSKRQEEDEEDEEDEEAKPLTRAKLKSKRQEEDEEDDENKGDENEEEATSSRPPRRRR